VITAFISGLMRRKLKFSDESSPSVVTLFTNDNDGDFDNDSDIKWMWPGNTISPSGFGPLNITFDLATP
jgi:hypothetical protein